MNTVTRVESAEWFWTDRWMGSSAFLLPISARGLYREMLTQAWRRGARLPNSEDAIRRAIGCTTQEWKRDWPKVQPYWRVVDGFLVNDTQVEIYEEAQRRAHEKSDRARAAGLKSAASRRRSNSGSTAVEPPLEPPLEPGLNSSTNHATTPAQPSISISVHQNKERSDVVQRPPSARAVPRERAPERAVEVVTVVRAGANRRDGLIMKPGEWGVHHSSHVTGYCDWMCLPADLFEQFVTRLGSHDRAAAFAYKVRASGIVPSGRPYDFWNRAFADEHPAPKTPSTTPGPLTGVREALRDVEPHES